MERCIRLRYFILDVSNCKGDEDLPCNYTRYYQDSNQSSVIKTLFRLIVVPSGKLRIRWGVLGCQNRKVWYDVKTTTGDRCDATQHRFTMHARSQHQYEQRRYRYP